jgi:hypothetical protein
LSLARGLALLCVLVSAAGCVTGSSDADVQRATEGPTAEEVFMSRFAKGYGRVPTFDESTAFQVELDQRVSDYLNKHPELATSPRASQFTFHRRVAVGMTKEEVGMLAGVPYELTEDPTKMQAAARQFWPAVKERAKEMWVYPGGWHLYFDGERLVDLTVSGKPPL